MSNISAEAVVQATGVAAIDLFLKTYSNFVALFDYEELGKVLNDELQFVGVSEQTKQSISIVNFFKDVERLTWGLLERGALRRIQKFGITVEAQAEIDKMELAVKSIPRGATGGRTSSQTTSAAPEPVSKWAGLTNEQFNLMSSSEVKRLRQIDPDFRVAVERLAEEEAATKPALTATGRVFLKRSDGQFFESFRNGEALFTPSFDSRAHMAYSEGHRIICMLASRGVHCEAFEMGSGILTDVAPKTVAPVEKTASTKKWRFENSGLVTQGNIQRRIPQGQFILKAGENLYVGAINDTDAVIKTVSQIGNAKKFSHLQSAIEAAQSFDLIVCICDHNGNQVSTEVIKHAVR